MKILIISILVTFALAAPSYALLEDDLGIFNAVADYPYHQMMREEFEEIYENYRGIIVIRTMEADTESFNEEWAKSKFAEYGLDEEGGMGDPLYNLLIIYTQSEDFDSNLLFIIHSNRCALGRNTLLALFKNVEIIIS